MRRGKREYIWSCVNVINDTVILDGSCDAFPIVVRDDWARDASRASTLEKGAVLLRVTGDVRVTTDDGAGNYAPGGANFSWAIGKFDEDDATVLDLATNFFGEDWLQMRGGSCWHNNPTTSAYSPDPGQLFPALDIRVKRKLTSEDEIRFVFGGYDFNGGSASGDLLSVSYQFRSLIQLP